MKLLSFVYEGRESWGAMLDDGVVEYAGITDRRYSTLAEFIRSEDFARRDRHLSGARATIAASSITYLPPIPQPEKIVCLLRNYSEPGEEDKVGDQPSFPPIFLRVWRSQVGHHQPIIRPRVSTQLDWEGEMAMVIGKTGRHIPESDAMNYVAGYSCYNDVSVRDWQAHAKQIAAGKNFIGTGPFGPWLVTADEIGDAESLKIETRLNGEVVQSSNTKQLIFKLGRIIAYASTIFDLVPGDVLVTGTPAGAGFTRKPPRFMKHGDLVEVEIQKIGTLQNLVQDEASATKA
jgi:2-keto-4-pentenoate hydratase/2-oxohepta-3-ene-1,7-dioic acid hydratase in catechol pathway